VLLTPSIRDHHPLYPPRTGRIRLVVYDLTGRRVRTLVRGVQPPGRYSVVWDGKDVEGREIASGIYLYRLEAVDRGFVATKQMLLVR
jgi:flagellar hook assembly protein FlgD